MEIDYNKLKDTGIRAEDRKGDKQKMHCPECHSQRKNKADKSLSVDWVKCVAHCHHCDQSFFFGKTEKIGFTPAPAPAPSTEPRKPGKLMGEEQPDKDHNPYEERDPTTGQRSYCGVPIPDGAPPRPNAQAVWNNETKQWKF